MRYFKEKKLINYELVVNKDAPFTYEIKDSVVFLNVKENRDCKEVWDFLYNNFDVLYRKCYDAKYRRFDGKEILHYLGKKYIFKTKKSAKNEVVIDKYTITIYTTKNIIDQQKEVYHKFLKRAVEQYLCTIYNEIENDFKEIKLPEFIVRGFRERMWGYNDLNANKIYLSYNLGKFDEKYIKTIIYHEICHCFIPYHNEDFYKLLDEKLKDGRVLENDFDKMIYNDKF